MRVGRNEKHSCARSLRPSRSSIKSSFSRMRCRWNTSPAAYFCCSILNRSAPQSELCCAFERSSPRRSRQSLVYVAEFAARSGKVSTTSNDLLVDEKVYRGQHRVVSDSQVALSARHVLKIAQREVDTWTNAERGLPVYVEGDTPWHVAESS